MKKKKGIDAHPSIKGRMGLGKGGGGGRGWIRGKKIETQIFRTV